MFKAFQAAPLNALNCSTIQVQKCSGEVQSSSIIKYAFYDICMPNDWALYSAEKLSRM